MRIVGGVGGSILDLSADNFFFFWVIDSWVFDIEYSAGFDCRVHP